jgi:hypothetical protein
MSKIKTGSTVQVTALDSQLRDDGCNSKIFHGSVHKITEIFSDDFCLDDLNDGLITKDYVKLIDKWTIYNNTLPWSELSDKQKGKMLLAAHSNVLFKIKDGMVLDKVKFMQDTTTYCAIVVEEDLVELFKIDWFNGGQSPDDMINKGWARK